MGMLDGRVAVVTGAAQGIGEVYARALADEGASVVVADIQGDAAEKVADAIRSAGAEALAVAVDVSDRDSTVALADQVCQAFGAAHVVVNNAAIYHSMRTDPLLEVDIGYWRKVFSVNVDGALLVTQALAPMLIEAGWGRVVNQTSTAAYMSTGGHYGASKLALVGVTRGLARELGRHNVTVNAIAPGPIMTDATASVVPADRIDQLAAQAFIPRRADADVLVGTLLYLCGDGAAWVTGQTLFVDGGSTPRI
jgi:3-oxoacyl-[acyl-carrier protein] reductase